MWAPASDSWEADGDFIGASDEEGGGRWHLSRDVPRGGWHVRWEEVLLLAQNTPFRHLAFFPDMAPQWEWMRARVAEGDSGAQPVRLYRRGHARTRGQRVRR